MRTLILLRHGTAERAAASGRDDDRALTREGFTDAQAAGRFIAARAPRPRVALVSPALRTRQTLAGAAEAFPGLVVRVDAALLHTSAERILQAAEAAGAEVVLVVGHNPGVGELAEAFAAAGGDTDARAAFSARGFAPASVAVGEAGEDGRLRLAAFSAPEGRP